MSVYIPGMEMPKHYMKMDFGYDADGYPQVIVGEEVYDVISVPSHGRLIDADAADEYAYDELSISPGYRTPYEASRNMQKLYMDMPTIIPADKEMGYEEI